MRQVPRKYLIIGHGRLASHLANYFQLLEIPYVIWSRSDSKEALLDLIPHAKKILIAIKDDAIEGFINEHQLPHDKTIHFSGSLSTPLATRLHPLMTFTNSMYSLNEYQNIPFVGEINSPPLSQMIPEFENPYYVISSEQASLYHALCVLAGNGTIVLWQSIFKSFEKELHLPKEVLVPYLLQITKNLVDHPETALTGPWVRNDQLTISKNQKSLAGTPLSSAYLSLLNQYQSSRPQGGPSIRSLT